MNQHFLRIVTLAIAFAATSAFAHDPAEHAKEAAASKAGLDCSQMKGMDHSKMDPNDPVMKAMMTQCAGKMDHSHMDMPGMDHSKMPMSASPSPDAHGGH